MPQCIMPIHWMYNPKQTTTLPEPLCRQFYFYSQDKEVELEFENN